MTAHDRRAAKVVRIIARLNVGGPARHVLLLNDALSRQGYDTRLVYGSIGPGEASFEHLLAATSLATHKIPELGRAVRPFSDVSAFKQLLRLLFKEAPDIVHTHTAKAGGLGRLAAALYNVTRLRKRQCVIVHTFHGHVLEGYFSNLVSRIIRLVEWLLARLTDCTVVISESQRRDLVDRFRVASASRTVVVPLGLDLAPMLVDRQKDEARRVFHLQEGQFVIGYVGRFVPIKSLETLVRAFAVVAREKHDAVLLLAGGGPARPQLEALGAQLNVADRMVFAGWTEDLAALYSAIDVCCLSSLNEGTPVALIEAMAAGKPVVATSVGGVVDLIEHGRTGVLVRPNDVEELAAAILQVAGDVNLRQTLGNSARTTVVARFSVERLTRDIDGIYQELLRGKRGG